MRRSLQTALEFSRRQQPPPQSVAHLLTLFMSFILFTFSTGSWAEIYKWTDAKGTVHYSDTIPTDSDAQVITPTSAIDGVRLLSDEAKERYKNRPSEPEPGNPPSANSTRPVASAQESKQTEDILCDDVNGDCFSEEDTRVCKLRFGKPCEEIYLWKVCALQKQCTTDRCDTARFVIDWRPPVVGVRDLGRSLPLRANVSDKDWRCLRHSGFYCDELALETQCQQDYRESCGVVRDWLLNAPEKCEKDKNVDCDELDTLIKYRPVSEEERLKIGGTNASGGRFARDLLMEKVEQKKNELTDEALQSVLDKLPGAGRHSFRKDISCSLKSWRRYR
ncbi:hypothetical protein HCH_01284 [Hahella chejuensis KCTC 2396]|uniref:DUF4124 domain-containing protein n=1 Tax=Hahella chejuensis (strain KCTC 2396) TaxID=349521 RepID=Q2SMH2_HAHCH|nr:DUF4124 domain-containing protein [Hahella chejuensis]ABC28152.1 hypothetical protein HCH_01284 [Hahella chejuensis KCTC 2396]